jgi:cytochrome c-type biogenesis protein CcmE
MRPTRTKLIVAAVVLSGAVGLLAYAGVQRGWVYYLDVDQFAAGEQHHDRRVRLNGHVAAEGVQVSAAKLFATFDLVGPGAPGARVPVHYTGVVPAMFQPGGQVVVEGKLDERGVFQADVLMTKCASKYQADEHAKTLGQLKHEEQQ